ncbi:hypothetical protein [Sphingobacterium zeae]|uniref:Uncharacterized protein n=1 Tax=Sphingobacterium zeae TaxID=1776859 RepID=A0ABU0UC90_9SPHI|nr:hypothetical protein [Sphingobacterium zeae]MDQ1152472.1 hypothetical protein [Sphingobacterium zeae]
MKKSPGAELQGQMAGERFCGQGTTARYLSQVVCSRQRRAKRKRPAELVV